jgi:hypothetical protein
MQQSRRIKVQRGWRSYKSVITEGQRIYYNFVKPHQILGGKILAEAVGIKGKNNWKDLLCCMIILNRFLLMS